jgi:hypothetical protein
LPAIVGRAVARPRADGDVVTTNRVGYEFVEVVT